MPGEQQRARTARTRAKIKHALAEVMRQKGFDALTVSDVARAAGINRGTVYLHFSDKDDMINQLEGEFVALLDETLLSDGGEARGAGAGGPEADGVPEDGATPEAGAAPTPGGAADETAREAAAAGGLAGIFTYERILAALKVVTDDFEFVSAVAGKGGDPEFQTKLRTVMCDLLEQGLERSGLSMREDEVFGKAYARELAVGQIMTIVNVWLAGDGGESPEQVARMICAAQMLPPTYYVV